MNYQFLKPRSEIPFGEVKSKIVDANPTTWKLEKDGYLGINTLIYNSSGSTITVTINKDETNTVSIATANTPVPISGQIEEIKIAGATSGVTIVTEALSIKELQKEGVISS